MARIRVLVIDDSALMRQLMSDILADADDIEVVGTAADPYKAREKILALHPDVLTLDVEMPRMDGLTFLGKLMRSRPMPVVMVSSLTEKGCDTTIRALELGAVDFVTKPRIDVSTGMVTLGEELVQKIRTASVARVTRAQPVTTDQAVETPRGSEGALLNSTHKIIAVGTSTGGTQALTRILPQLPPDTPGTAVVIHMPPGFTGSFAKRLDSMCQMNVREAEDGDVLIPGRILIAPGQRHMTVTRSGARYIARLTDDVPVNQFRPSVDVLFESVAEYVGRNAVAVMLTGMGCDGARGFQAVHQAGGRTIAQDEATSIVFGMPREAIKTGAADQIVPLDEVPSQILSDIRCMSAGAS